MLARYYTAEQLADILGIGLKQVYDFKRTGLIIPALTKGLEQYDRTAVLKLAVFLAIRDVFRAPTNLVHANDGELTAFAATLDGVDGDALGPIVLKAPAFDVEIRPTIVAALRERLAKVPA